MRAPPFMKPITIYVDADARPGKQEIYGVAKRSKASPSKSSSSATHRSHLPRDQIIALME
jgi:uncharacterized protein YaiI (UPF0178 family)